MRTLLRTAAAFVSIGALVACGSVVSPTRDGSTATDGQVATDALATDAPRRPMTTSNVDLLVLIDNSNSMHLSQEHFVSNLSSLIDTLLHPLCTNPSNPTPHACSPDPTDRPVSPALTQLHVGVVSQDLGTPGSNVPGCADAMLGDDGLLNPIRNGPAFMHHAPAPPSMFQWPPGCSSPSQFPAFITYASDAADATCSGSGCDTDAATFTHDFACNAGLSVGGCGLEQQLEALYRALIEHDASQHVGNSSPNAGFLRDDAVLAMLLLTDEEDGSVRDYTYANGQPCIDATDVFSSGSMAWSDPNLNLRDYMYQPGGSQDPTWPLERYIDPAHPTAGFLGLKPGHPERLIFTAITGVPLQIPMTGDQISWDALLGAVSGNGPDDFNARNSRTAIDMMSAEGPISMRQANRDPNCPERVVPACRRQGSSYSPTACTSDLQYFAWPGRRIVEVARRFDQAPLCNGAPCRNGYVSSICANEYSTPMAHIARMIQTRMGAQ